MKNKRLWSGILAIFLFISLIPSAAAAPSEEAPVLSGQAAGRDREWPDWKEAYWEIVTDRYEEEADSTLPTHSRYTLSDIDKDGLPELLVGMLGVSYSVTSIYTYTKGKAKLVGEIEEGHGTFCGVPEENGILECYEAQGHIYIALWKMKGNKLTKDKTIYDDDYYDVPYPHPDSFYPGAIDLPKFDCDDESGLATYENWAGGYQSDREEGDLQTSYNVGDVVLFGHYEQDNNLSNGKEEIEWYVLEADNDQLLLISRYALDCKYFNLDNKGYKWEKCYLRTWLNGTFLKNAFTSEEQERILVTTVTADVNPYAKVNSGKDTEDKVFLLSYPEFEEYLIYDELSICYPTAYAIKQGVRPTVDDSCWWWLRSPGRNSYFALTVDYKGQLYPGGYMVNKTTLGVRPAIWIDLGS